MTVGSRPHRLRILCVDDNIELGDVMVWLLQHAGHIAEHAPGGAEVWSRFGRNPADFDLIVTDHRMPGMTGLEMVRELRKNGFSGPVILQTSGVSLGIAEAYRRLGIRRIILKGRGEELLAAVEAELVRP